MIAARSSEESAQKTSRNVSFGDEPREARGVGERPMDENDGG
jgi:hypothetical protein